MAGLSPPRFVDHGALTIAGLSRTYTPATVSQLLKQWTEMRGRAHLVTGRVGGDAYGLWFDVINGGREFTYVTGVAVGLVAPAAAGLSLSLIAPQHYAVFTHDGPSDTVRQTIDAVLGQWLPQSGRELARMSEAPDFFERYTEEYNRTGSGPIEIWFAIKKQRRGRV